MKLRINIGKPVTEKETPSEVDLDIIMTEALLIARKNKQKADAYYKAELAKAIDHA